MKKKKIIAAVTSLLLVCALALITTCELEVAAAVQRVALTDPYISRQPASSSWFVGEVLPDPFTLSIEVTDWIADDGELTYQWYTFTDIDDYVKNGGTRIDGGNGLTYTPTLKTEAGDKNYYYVTVTNTNTNVNAGPKTGEIQSEVAIISFTAAGGALPPIISRHPGSADYQVGRAMNALTVRAAVRVDNNVPRTTVPLSYEWYILTVDTDEDGTITIGREPIPNATSSSYEPDPSTLQFGKNYFYAKVTSTEAAGEASEESIPSVINIAAGARAGAPTIRTQPKDRMYFIGDPVEALKIEAVSRDNGAISYQWYSSATAVIPAAGGTLVPGETATEFTPPISTDAAAEPSYYYAVVTNTNNYVSGEKTAAAISKVAKVSVAAYGTLAHNAVVTVANPKDPANRYQYVRGYGGMDVAWANFPEQKPEDMETMYNPDILGYNINRIMISPGNVDPVAEVERLIGAHRPNYYENVKIVNKYGGYNLASPWSPPKEWKTNNSINGGGDLIEAYYQQFADYLKTFAQNMYDQGAPIYAISISNEPNYTAGYDGCEWTPNQMRNFYRQVGRFTEGVRGYGGGRQIPTVLTVNGESANTPDINIAALVDPVSRAAIDLLCRHVYGVQTTTLWRFGPGNSAYAGVAPNDHSGIPNILDRGDGTKMEVWMTEHNINSANATAYPFDSTWNYVWRYMNDVDLVMRLNNENAFVWWASKRFYSMIGDGQYNTREGAPLPRGWGLSHYAKYTIDTYRIAATVTGTLANNTPIDRYEAVATGANPVYVNERTFSLDNVSARVTAYASIASGKDNAPIVNGADDVEFISLVMWTPTDTGGRNGVDMGTIKIEMPAGFDIGSYTAIKSSAPEGDNLRFHLPETVTIASDRKSAYVTLNGSQMLSVKFIKQ